MKNQMKTIFLLGALSTVLIGIGGALGPGYLYGFTALAMILNLARRLSLRTCSLRPRACSS